MSDDLTPWEALDRAVAEEATKQGLERPAWVTRHLALPATATEAEVRAAVTEFRRANPWWVKTTDGGMPEVLEGAHPRPDRGRRERRPDGTSPPKPGMGDALRALMTGEGDDDPNVARLTQSAAPAAAAAPPAADSDDKPKPPGMSEALRALAPGAGSFNEAVRRRHGG